MLPPLAVNTAWVPLTVSVPVELASEIVVAVPPDVYPLPALIWVMLLKIVLVETGAVLDNATLNVLLEKLCVALTSCAVKSLNLLKAEVVMVSPDD
jgi:hypothetical protein